MKKWMYVISVGSMLAIFLVFFLSATKKRKAHDQKVAIEVAARKGREGCGESRHRGQGPG